MNRIHRYKTVARQLNYTYDMIKNWINFFNSINPLHLYLTLIYVVSKIFESNDESFWQKIWSFYMKVFGESRKKHLMVLMNFYMFFIYWLAAFAFYSLEFCGAAKKFKIQTKKSEVGKNISLSKVILNFIDNLNFEVIFRRF